MAKPGRGDTRPFIVTVVTEHYVDVEAADEDHARRIIERRLHTEFSATRRPRITEIESADA